MLNYNCTNRKVQSIKKTSDRKVMKCVTNKILLFTTKSTYFLSMFLLKYNVLKQ